MKMQRNQMVMVVLVILLVVAVGYIAYDKYTQSVQLQQMGLIQQGAQYGYQQAVVQLIQQAAQCQPVPVTYQNTTINVVAVECFQQAQQ